jgi:hypothetical protein
MACPGLVVRDEVLLFLREHRVPSGTDDEALEGVLDDLISDYSRVVIARDRGDRALVEHVRQLGPGEPRGLRGDGREVDVGGESLALGVDAEDALPPRPRWEGHLDFAVEPPGAEEGVVQDVDSIRRGEDDDLRIFVESIHLGEDLVQRLFSLVVRTRSPGCSLFSNCI